MVNETSPLNGNPPAGSTQELEQQTNNTGKDPATGVSISGARPETPICTATEQTYLILREPPDHTSFFAGLAAGFILVVFLFFLTIFIP